jgi:hypothetical protein
MFEMPKLTILPLEKQAVRADDSVAIVLPDDEF